MTEEERLAPNSRTAYERAAAAEAALQSLHAAEPSRAENAKLRGRVAELEAALTRINHGEGRTATDLQRIAASALTQNGREEEK